MELNVFENLVQPTMTYDAHDRIRLLATKQNTTEREILLTLFSYHTNSIQQHRVSEGAKKGNQCIVTHADELAIVDIYYTTGFHATYIITESFYPEIMEAIQSASSVKLFVYTYSTGEVQ